jgi:hypothetical protein
MQRAERTVAKRKIFMIVSFRFLETLERNAASAAWFLIRQLLSDFYGSWSAGRPRGAGARSRLEACRALQFAVAWLKRLKFY